MQEYGCLKLGQLEFLDYLKREFPLPADPEKDDFFQAISRYCMRLWLMCYAMDDDNNCVVLSGE
ncbi:MAG: hypothetical protein ABH832_02360 [bacterium]